MGVAENIEGRLETLRSRVPALLVTMAPYAAVLLVTWLYYGEFLKTGAKACHRDWIYFHTMAAVSRESLLSFDTIPLWNPFTCGGIEHLGNPQTSLLSPLFVLTLVFGFSFGIKLFAVAHLALGMVGSVLLGREIGLKGAGAAAFAIFIMGCGFFPWHLHAGHLTFVQFAWLPWILWCYLRASGNFSYAAMAAIFLALAVISGGTYVAPFAMVLLGGHGVLAAATDVPRWRPATVVVAIAAMGGLLAAVKILPALEFVSAYARPPLPDGDATMDLGQLMSALFEHKWRGKGLVLDGWEYTNYVGVGAAVLALATIPWGVRKSWPWLVMAALAAALACGDFGAWAPYTLLSKLPVFSSLRVPSRYSLVLVIALAVASAYGATALRARAAEWSATRRFVIRGAVVVLTAIAVVAMVRVNQDVVKAKICKDDPGTVKRVDRFHIVKGDFDRMWQYPRNGQGTEYCRAPMKYQWGRTWRGDKSQVAVEPPDAGSAELVAFSPGHWRIRGSLDRGATVLLNQNHRDTMRISDGTLVKVRGLMGVKLPAGPFDVTIDYWAPAIGRGLLCSLLGLVVVVAVFLRHRLRALVKRRG